MIRDPRDIVISYSNHLNKSVDDVIEIMNTMNLQLVIHTSYFIAAILFIFGLQRMSSPVTARNGIVWAGAGMVLATLVTFLYPGMSNFILMIV